MATHNDHTIEDLPDYIMVKKSRRARRLALRLDAKDRRFHLVIPKGMSLKRAVAFAEEHDAWMNEKLRLLPEEVELKDGRRIPVLGKMRRIRVSYDRRLERTEIEMTERDILVSTPLRDPAPRIQRFLKNLARETLTEMAERKANRLGRPVQAITIRDPKTRWGSCSEDGKIAFSWRLILAPPAAMDYVVAHEVAHLEHMDHSDRFWTCCRRLSREYLEGKFWMQNHAHELMRYSI